MRLASPCGRTGRQASQLTPQETPRAASLRGYLLFRPSESEHQSARSVRSAAPSRSSPVRQGLGASAVTGTGRCLLHPPTSLGTHLGARQLGDPAHLHLRRLRFSQGSPQNIPDRCCKRLQPSLPPPKCPVYQPQQAFNSVNEPRARAASSSRGSFWGGGPGRRALGPAVPGLSPV